MARLVCPICEHANKISSSAKEGERFTCFNCNAQLRLEIREGRKILRCAFCKKDMIECGSDCETRIFEREKIGFFDVKLS